MTGKSSSTAYLSVVLNLFSKKKEGKRGRCGGQDRKGYRDYEIDQRNEINIVGDFENITPTHIGAAHVF